MKKLVTALALVASIAGSNAIAAPVFSLTGGYAGPIVIRFQDWESVLPGLAVGAENFGILRITAIEDTSGNSIWIQGGTNGFLAGIFNDLIIQSVAPSGAGVRAQATGGHLAIYSSNTAPVPTQGLSGYAAAGCLPGDLCYHTISDNAGGDLFLALDFVSGVDPTNSSVTLDATFTTTTFPVGGTAASYLDVIGGSHAAMFDTNTQTTVFGNRDVYLTNGFCPNGNPTCGNVGDWQLISTDPARAAVIPEPGTVALFGVALALVSGFARRRRS